MAPKGHAKRRKQPNGKGHVSGLSSNKSGKRSRQQGDVNPRLSRKQRNELHEYGELNPLGMNGDDEDDDTALQRRRFVDDQDEDGFIDDEAASGAVEPDEDDEYEKPSTYNQLMASLARTSKYQDYYNRQMLEEKGIDEVGQLEDATEDEASDEVDDDDDFEQTDLPEDVEEGSDNASEGEAEIPDEDSDDNVDDPQEPSDDETANDPFEAQFGADRNVSLELDIGNNKKNSYEVQQFENAHLKRVTVATLPEHHHMAAMVQKLAPINESAILSRYKAKLQARWKDINQSLMQSSEAQFTELQAVLAQSMGTYIDHLFCNRDYKIAPEIINTYVLHVLNHVLKTRDRILKNNQKISKAHLEGKEIGDIRDQGFTRPRVMILLPFKNTAKTIIDALIKLSGAEQCENRKRFESEFSLPPGEDNLAEDKPEDFNATFRGNIDDHFRIGVKFTRKSIKLYSNFYDSDVLIGSPLGFRTIIGSRGDQNQDFDFLSSIEVMIVDQTTDMLMQNWDHVQHIFDHMNLIPKDPHGCDFSRVKMWYLDGNAKYLRQNIIFTDFLTPEINALVGKYAQNVGGSLRMAQPYDGSIEDVTVEVPQRFQRIEIKSLASADDERFRFFLQKTLPDLRRSAVSQKHTLIFVPSYFDYIRLRNYFSEEGYSFGGLNEYAESRDISTLRSNYFTGRVDILLYTERFHFFRRYKIRGTYHVVFYALPENPRFYPEVVNFLGLRKDASASEDMTTSCLALFTRFDALKLERIVGSQRVYCTDYCASFEVEGSVCLVHALKCAAETGKLNVNAQRKLIGGTDAQEARRAVVRNCHQAALQIL
ncbi:hypothetical protein BZG36_05300, partial [Bifiguratus adelaidae]